MNRYRMDAMQLQKLMLKKIRLEVGSGQAILLLSNKHEQIEQMLNSSNMLLKTDSLASAIQTIERNKKAFTYIIADLDLPSLDDLDSFLKQAAPLIIRPGKLILTATNLCTDANKLQILFDNAPQNFQRPSRAVAPKYLKNLVLNHGYFIKNRYWQYDDKLLMIAETPINS